MPRLYRTPTLLITVATALAVAGCIGLQSEDVDTLQRNDDLQTWIPEDVEWDTSGDFSTPLEEGPFDVLEPEVHRFESHDGATLTSAVWRPDVPADTDVPVILRISPYYFQGVDHVAEGGHTQQMWLDGIVSHGFAYAQVAIRGTADADGCMEFFGENEQKDTDEAVTYYGQQPWSNGNVAIWGGSYDGTTPWMAAMHDNPHLKTILPLSGLTSIYEHAYRNGTPVAFSPVFHPIYWSYGWTTDDRTPGQWIENTACPESIHGTLLGPYTTLTGEKQGTPVTDDYWETRDFRDRVLENYDGSVFLIHGMQDWRVPPHMAFPFLNELSDNGVKTKALLGQWWHDFPDRADRGENVRWDHAETLLRWLTSELKDEDIPTGPAVDIQDSQGHWRTEDRWPPNDTQWAPYHLGANELTSSPDGNGEMILTTPGNTHDTIDDALIIDGANHPRAAEYSATLGPLEEELRFAGSPRLHVTVTPTTPEGSRMYAELAALGPYGERDTLAHAVMDLRYHEGGTEKQTLTPGEPITAQIEFFPADAVVPPGQELELRLVNGVGYMPARDGYAAIDNFIEHPAPGPVILHWGEDSVLTLPQLERDIQQGTYPGQP